MLDLKDFNHLPVLDDYFEQIAEDAPGLTVVAGLEPPPQSIAAALKLPPSGRGMVFGILVRRVFERVPARPHDDCRGIQRGAAASRGGRLGKSNT